MLHVNPADRENVAVSYRNAFFIELPQSIPEPQWDLVSNEAIVDWMKNRVLFDAQGFVRKYSRTTGLIPQGIRVAEQKSFWGTCGKDNVIRINWRLAYLPKKVLEYVVTHEIVHLKYRNHSDAFWNLLWSVFNEVDTCQRVFEGKRGL
jgi:predicted metal-dependent hydrolase